MAGHEQALIVQPSPQSPTRYPSPPTSPPPGSYHSFSPTQYYDQARRSQNQQLQHRDDQRRGRTRSDSRGRDELYSRALRRVRSSMSRSQSRSRAVSEASSYYMNEDGTQREQRGGLRKRFSRSRSRSRARDREWSRDRRGSRHSGRTSTLQKAALLVGAMQVILGLALFADKKKRESRDRREEGQQRTRKHRDSDYGRY